MTGSANKRIVKNSIFLFARMFVLLLINLFTSRIILDTLGIEDYGIYNVVGSIVVMCAFINNRMCIKSIQRVRKLFSTKCSRTAGHICQKF